ncbi:formylglycine-generating enzyme family protein [Cupriavidus sp. NPDC089707]|uniref:formylglycine-generating enzyme family protein n=1 Tax=Cupriavidus sp. NPDC089707 TaxID=3363963 RepID=UPI0038268FB4
MATATTPTKASVRVASPAQGVLSWCMVAVVAIGGHAMASPDPSAERLCAAYNGVPAHFGPARAGQPNRAGMVRIPAGQFRMGSDAGYPEERNVHLVRLDSFLIDRHHVTNAEFALFVRATGYLTTAERRRDAKDFPGVPGSQLVPGSVVFNWPTAGSPFDRAYRWWKFQPGASWRHPTGPGSDLRGLAHHPVVHVSYDDAMAYARWLGRDLPTEAEYEYAARGGRDGATYPWGNARPVDGQQPANTWQGDFPASPQVKDGYKGTAPVGCFAPNGYGLFDAVGNVWQWTRDIYRDRHPHDAAENPMVVRLEADSGRRQQAERVIKGGSFLCAPNFCIRYRPSSRQPQDPTLSTMHLGFRTVLRLP